MILDESDKSSKPKLDSSEVRQFDVQQQFITWRKETTCRNCHITYENFHTLLNHSCLPYRCSTCFTGFLFDYKLKMHTCDNVRQSVARQSEDKVTYSCTACSLTFFEVNLLSNHQSFCPQTQKTHCKDCKKVLSVRDRSEFCRKCRLIRSKNKNLIKFNKYLPGLETSESTSAECSIGVDSFITNLSKSNKLNSFKNLRLSKAERKRFVDDKQNHAILSIEDKHKRKKKNSKVEHTASNTIKNSFLELADNVANNIGDFRNKKLRKCHNLKLLNIPLEDKVLKNLPKKDNQKTVKIGINNKNDSSIRIADKKCKPKRMLAKQKFAEVKACNFIESSVEIDSVMTDYSDCRSSDVSSYNSSKNHNMKRKRNLVRNISETCSKMDNSTIIENNLSSTSLEEKNKPKRKFANEYRVKKIRSQADTSSNFSKESVLSVTDLSVKKHCKKRNFDTSSTNDRYSKRDELNSHVVQRKKNGTVKSEKFMLFPKKNSSVVKIPYLMENVPNGAETPGIERVGEINNVSQIHSKVIPFSSEIETPSPSVEIYTPVLEISESTLNCVPDDIVSLTKSFNSEGGESKNNGASNSDNDNIKLESLLNALPNSDSGVILRIASKSGENFRCLKCNKLFKRLKAASCHYKSCKSPRLKKKMLVPLNDIKWICLECNFHCNYVSELTVHKQSCTQSSEDIGFNIESCINRYSKTCQQRCSKCNYMSISSLMFSQHNCHKRLKNMGNCRINIKLLTKDDLLNANLSKYTCLVCDAKFHAYSAYKNHVMRHSGEVSCDPNSCCLDGETYTKEIVRKSVEQSEDSLAFDDIIQCWIEPYLDSFSYMANPADYILPSLNINVSVGETVNQVLPSLAERVFEKDGDLSEINLESLIKNSSCKSALQSEIETLLKSCEQPENNANLISDARAPFLKGFKCLCEKGKEWNANKEKKPCLPCLHNFLKISIEEIELFYSQGYVEQTSAEVLCSSSSSNLYESPSENVSSSSATYLGKEVPVEWNVASGSNAVFNCNFEQSSITDSCHLNTTSTSENGIILNDCIADSDDANSEHDLIPEDNISISENSGFELPEEAPANKTSDPLHRTLYGKCFRNSVQREIPIEEDFTTIKLVGSRVLKFENTQNLQQNYNKLLNALYNFRNIYLCGSSISDFLPNYSKFIESGENCTDELPPELFEPLSFAGAYNQDAAIAEIHNWEALNHPALPHDLPPGSPCAKDFLIFDIPFVDLMYFLCLLSDCCSYVILSNRVFDIHITWNYLADVTYSAYSEETGSQSRRFVCGACFDCFKAADLLKHFFNEHGDRVMNILIA